MVLKNKYVIGCLVMFYEVEMLPEYIESILGAVDGVENPENITIELCINLQEYFETIDVSQIPREELVVKFQREVDKLTKRGLKLNTYMKDNNQKFYNISQYRRDVIYHWCDWVDFVIWGEIDSLLPKQAFDVIERISSEAANQDVHRYTITFGYRKNWDKTWDVLCHPKFRDVEYIDDLEWIMQDPASSKSYMSYEHMCTLNDQVESYDVGVIREPKFDGSFLVMSSDFLRMGINIPQGTHGVAEDTALGEIAKKILGKDYVQYTVNNILRVHNRRHPRKRMYIKDEDNHRGFVGKQKGGWWDVWEGISKHNLSILYDSQKPFITIDQLMGEIKKVRKK